MNQIYSTEFASQHAWQSGYTARRYVPIILIVSSFIHSICFLFPCTLCPKVWKENSWKAGKSVPKVHSISATCRGSEWHARPSTAVSHGPGLLQLEKACSRLLRSPTMTMIPNCWFKMKSAQLKCAPCLMVMSVSIACTISSRQWRRCTFHWTLCVNLIHRLYVVCMRIPKEM